MLTLDPTDISVIELEGNRVRCTYLFGTRQYIGSYQFASNVIECEQAMYDILARAGTSMIYSGHAIRVRWFSRNRLREMIMRLAPLALLPPPRYGASTMIPKSYETSVMFTYAGSVFSSSYPDSDGKILDAMKKLITYNTEPETKDELLNVSIWNKDWIHALNSLHAFRFFNRQIDAIEWFISQLVPNYLMLLPSHCRLTCVPVAGKMTVQEISLVFRETDLIGEVMSMLSSVYCDQKIVDLSDIPGWTGPARYVVYT